jgi:hypothetical protein
MATRTPVGFVNDGFGHWGFEGAGQFGCEGAGQPLLASTSTRRSEYLKATFTSLRLDSL